MPATIIFNQINVNSVEFNSAVTTGQNNQSDWSTTGKSLFGQGINVGVVFTASNLNIINDQDVIDTKISQPELNNPQPNVQI
ncbi:hypothetical protein [Thermoflavimicrobium dichotomicum]|uniref:Spore germination protein gerPA/gerPF n=1 Tax=Thermoflavimicrobium dichotomicum TaxID=46223 RepID=A0A1I3P192_9BACL|nr:hypothetical protein [Thermoflavimicrobium dichotomicum]SFJ15328.1 hypothetical protein SAMN05421852_10553 [Thermoflavimicrobium dichotomicum]